jgi:hypothetical protein
LNKKEDPPPASRREKSKVKGLPQVTEKLQGERKSLTVTSSASEIF